MTTTEHAAEIRKQYKAKGWSSRDISVRADHFSMGSSIDVTVKRPDIPLAEVKAIAEQAESISRCEITGDILCGGNRYVHVGYSSTAHEARVAPFLPAIEAALVTLRAEPPTSGAIIPVGDTGFGVSRSWNGGEFSVWGKNSHAGTAYDAAGVASIIARCEAR